MRIAVLGAGVVGVTTAWYLRQAGHEVELIDRQPAVAQETSFANGGQISVSHSEPWANPGAPALALRWLGREDAPLLFRLRADPAQWLWGLRFLYQCLPWHSRANTAQAFRLALYSRQQLQQLRASAGLEYDHSTRGILYLYADTKGLKVAPDDLFPTIALSDTFSGVIGIIFILALISALFPSVDGAITSITSCFCIDMLDMSRKEGSEKEKRRTRLKVHFSFAVLFFLMVLVFKFINDKLIIDFILKFASITYGPLLGLFSFGILSHRQLKGRFVWLVCIVAPLVVLGLDVLCSPEWYEKKLHVSLGLSEVSAQIFGGYKIGNELILINGILTFCGLALISAKDEEHHQNFSAQQDRQIAS